VGPSHPADSRAAHNKADHLSRSQAPGYGDGVDRRGLRSGHHQGNRAFAAWVNTMGPSCGIHRSFGHTGIAVPKLGNIFFLMQIIALRTLRQFWERHPQAESPIRIWHGIASKAEWASTTRQSRLSVVVNAQVVRSETKPSSNGWKQARDDNSPVSSQVRNQPSKIQYSVPGILNINALCHRCVNGAKVRASLSCLSTEGRKDLLGSNENPHIRSG